MCYNVLKSCATRVCCACGDEIICVAVQYLTLRTGCEKHGRKNPLSYSFSKRSHIGNLRQIKKQGKGRSPKRKGKRRCPFLFAPAAGAALSRAPQSATPRCISAKNSPPVRGEPANAVRVPCSAGAEKRAATLGANTLTSCAALLSPRGPSLALRAIHLVPHSALINPSV